MLDDSMRYVAVAVGAVLGANLRFIVTNWTVDRWGAEFPYGTFVINVSGALVIGAFLAFLAGRAPISPLWRLFFVTGFLGGYTTFSSYSWEALSLGEKGAWRSFVLYVGGSNVLGLVGVWLGLLGSPLPEQCDKFFRQRVVDVHGQYRSQRVRR